MSRRIFLDVEEALSREVRRITFHDARTVDTIAFRDTFDPFTGEVVSMPIEPSFYDSSADAGAIQYPHFFIRLLKSREDRTTGRIIPLYGQQCSVPVIFSPGAYDILAQGTDGQVSIVGNTLNTGILKIAKVQPGHLIRLLRGNNKGTYIVDTIIKDTYGNHSINVSSTLIISLPAFNFDSGTRTISFSTPTDLNTLVAGDVFQDSSLNTFNITSVTPSQGIMVVDGATTPDASIGATVSRTGNIFTQVDAGNISFLIMDPNKPVKALTGDNKTSEMILVDPEVPIDAYYLIRIDSKEKENHTMVLNRMWEEFNPPRTALPIIKRSSLSAEGLLQEDIPPGGSNLVKMLAADVEEVKVGDKVFIFDDITPSKRSDGKGFERPFEAIIVGKPSPTEIELDTVVPDTYTVDRCSKLVTNADFRLYMFHFVDHVTKDTEGSQYWIHEFTFWVQIWVDRQGDGTKVNTITDVGGTLEENDDDGDDSNNYIYDDKL